MNLEGEKGKYGGGKYRSVCVGTFVRDCVCFFRLGVCLRGGQAALNTRRKVGNNLPRTARDQRGAGKEGSR